VVVDAAAFGIGSSSSRGENQKTPPRTSVPGTTRLDSVAPVNNNNSKKNSKIQPPVSMTHVPIHSEITTTTTNYAPSPFQNQEDANRSLPHQHPHPDSFRRRSPLLRHVGFVCDGNSRWAQARGLPAAMGHVAGADRFVDIFQYLRTTQTVRYCTWFGFSTENWQRPETEIVEIFRAMESAARRFREQLVLLENQNIQLRILGDLHDPRIPQSLRDILLQLQDETQQLQEQTHQNGNKQSLPMESITVCLAINYGGRQDIVNASKRLAMDIANGVIHPNQVSEADLAQRLYTHHLPDPDLIIRTSGERRLSNFLLWESAYAELYFTDTLWPDFDEAAMEKALDWYSQRQRRYGGRSK
jgi:undecaprenyl diphosphate synthase